MLGSLINKIDKLLGVIFFNNLNTCSYNLFNFFFKRNILNKKAHLRKYYLNNFDKYGFSRLDSFNINTLNKIKLLLELQNPTKGKNNRFQYKINPKIINLIKELINDDCNKILSDMRIYFNSNIYLGHALITRNYNYNPENGESYSSYYHCDGYLNTYFKILINLSDVTEDMGPIHVINKIDTKKNVGLFKYNSRNYKKEEELKSEIFVNNSKFGEGLLINTTECLHKAGIPKEDKYRDMLYLIFCAYPEKSKNTFFFEKTDHTIWQPYSDLVKKLSKPYGFKNTYNLYNKFSKNLEK